MKQNKKDRPKGMTNKGVEMKTLKQGLAWFKDRILKQIVSKVKGQRNQDMVARALVFSKVNTDSLVIIGDIRKDTITFSYGDKFMQTQIQSKFLHLNQKVIKRNLTKDFEGLNERQIKETRIEFSHIFQHLLFNFIEIICQKKDIDKQKNTEKI